MNGQLESFRKAPTPEKAKAILQKVRNNRVTDADFCNDIEDEIEQLRMYVAKTEHEKVEQENTQKQGSGEKTEEQVMLELAENYRMCQVKVGNFFIFLLSNEKLQRYSIFPTSILIIYFAYI